MIRIEDEGLENMVLAGESCIAVPFEIYVPSEGEPIITVYSFLKNAALEYAEKFEGQLLSADALKWLDDKIYAVVKGINYIHVDDESHFLMEYEADNCKEHYDRFILGKNIIAADDVLPADLDLTYFEDYNAMESISVICLDNGKAVSVSTTNDIVFDDKSVEICVETLPEYEGKGFGTATVAALCRYYNDKGVKVKYECAKTNVASVKIAEKCGFKLMGQRYSYVCYTIDEDE